MSAKVIQVIVTEVHRGDGVPGNPSRLITQYWTLDGELLAERDLWVEEQAMLHKRDSDPR
jgi:hypothetical protein